MGEQELIEDKKKPIIDLSGEHKPAVNYCVKGKPKGLVMPDEGKEPLIMI